MKLKDLFENTINLSGKTYEEFVEIIQRARQEHLLVSFNPSIAPIFLISDVPPINKEQFEKLKDISFPLGDDGERKVHVKTENITLYDKDLKEVDTWEESQRGRLRSESDRQDYEDLYKRGYGEKEITIFTWKEFVAHMHQKYPSDDDFSG